MNIGISKDNLAGVSHILNTLLADENLLYIKTRNYHWNVTGIHFHDLHKFFEGHYGELEELIDEVAERARTLGQPAEATLVWFLENTRLSEDPTLVSDSKVIIKNLLTDHESLCRLIREDITTVDQKFKDVTTTDFLTGLLAKHEKMAWMLRTILAL
jgi:starvation-inducible DNA-binding protein